GISGRGQIVGDQIFHLVDIMPTLCEIAGAEYPNEYKGRKITLSPGISMVPYWKGNVDRPENRTLYWQHLNHSAIREGDWKLVTLNDRDRSRWELYDLSGDRSETNDVITDNPEIAQRLKDKWHKWAEDVSALPFPEDRELIGKNPLSDINKK
ncbi:MAG: hypothetical protein KAR47_00005, partial [Planctomycetes bacterium]|nr:hypothetical protein [Planctomycetota bacterium]